MQLQNPAIRAAGVLQGLSPGDAVDVVLSRPGHRYCLDVNGRSTCGLGYSFGVCWALLAYAQVPFGWPHTALNLGSMAALLFPFGFWIRRRWESALGGLLLASCLGVLTMIGNLNASWEEVTAAFVGALVGKACAAAIASLACAGFAQARKLVGPASDVAE